MNERQKAILAEYEAKIAAEAQSAAPAGPEGSSATPEYMNAQPAVSTPEPTQMELLKKEAMKSPLGQFLGGASEFVTGVGSGVNQVAREKFGNEADAEKGYDQERRRKAFYEKLYDGNRTMAATAGELAPAFIPGPGWATAAAGAPRAAAFLGRAGGKMGGTLKHALTSVGSGAAGAYVAPTSEAGDRGQQALGGGMLAGAVPLASGATEFLRKTMRALPEEATSELTQRLGFGGGRASVSDALRGKLTAAKTRAVDVSNDLYDKARKLATGKPAQELVETNKAFSGITDLATEIKKAESPKLFKILNTVGEEAKAKQSVIQNVAGGQHMLPAPRFNYEDLDDARKELSALSTKLYEKGDKAGSRRVRGVIKTLDDDIKQFDAPTGPKVSEAAAKARANYKANVMPFEAGQTGKFIRDVEADPSALGAPEKTARVLRNAPEARPELRQLAGERIESGLPLRYQEAMTPEELTYYRAARKGSRRPPPSVTKFLPGSWDERLFSGVDPMGYTGRMSNFLRTGAVGSAVGYQAADED